MADSNRLYSLNGAEPKFLPIELDYQMGWLEVMYRLTQMKN